MKKAILGALLSISIVLAACGQEAKGTAEETNAEPAVAETENTEPEDAETENAEEADAAEANAGTDVTETANEGETAEKELTIYIVRHGKTFFNTTGQVQGFCDSPLTDTGIEQAEKVGKGLKDIPFTTAYCGELGRQSKTAELILAQNDNEVPSLVKNVGFNEWNYGGYEGGSNAAMWDPIFEKYGYTFDEEWTYYGEVYEILGDRGVADAIAANDELQAAESYDEILARAEGAMNQLVEESLAAGGGNVLVVSSGSQIPTILEMYVPDDYNGESIGNCSVTILKYKDGTYTLESIGDSSYLED